VDGSIPNRRFYATDLSPCPYRPGRLERRLVTLLDPAEEEAVLDRLTVAGFRRSQRFLYRPACPGCRACVPTRIDVAAFAPGRGFRKILKRNADLRPSERPARATDEQFLLFRRYIQARHGDGGMAEMGWRDFVEMVEEAGRSTRLVELRRADGRLAAVSLTDYVASGLSGVYKFFEPDEPERSLGTFLILWHVARARELGRPYVYLGYWIADCRKMAYKRRFPALEALEGWRWRPLPAARLEPNGAEPPGEGDPGDGALDKDPGLG
jgi:arginine-tRNA-protein transferase